MLVQIGVSRHTMATIARHRFRAEHEPRPVG